MECTAAQTEPERVRSGPNSITVDDAGIRIDETTELRWFFDGPLPTEVRRWFASTDVAGHTEHRVDSYRVDDQVGVGVKRRFGSVLELKSRHDSPRSFALPHGSHGQLERWTRWSPADSIVELQEHTQWIDVEKDIVKRRFDASGQEVSISQTTRLSVGRGCDAEIVEISLEDRPAWGVAFTAFGPLDAHPDLLRTAAVALFGDADDEWKERLDSGLSCGYPEWLVRTRQG